MSDLKACPFCGRIPDIEDCGEHRWFIRCKCGIAQDKLFFQKCDAVRAWNRRKELRVKDTNVPITDTISRQAAIDELCDNCDNVKAVCAHYPCKQYIAIEQLPPAELDIDGYSSKLWKAAYERGKRDATPVTCRECKHYYIFPNGTNGMCKKSNDAWTSFYPWDFCSHGERRTENADVNT